MPTANPFLYGMEVPGGGTAVLDYPGAPSTGALPTPAAGPELHGNAPISLSNFLTNPNTYRIAGEIAQGIPNNGIGTALGAVGSKAIGAIQQQKALEKAEMERQQRNRALIEALGGYTPPGTPGVTGVTVGKNGELKLTMDQSTGDIPPGEEFPAISPTASPANAVYPNPSNNPGAPAIPVRVPASIPVQNPGATDPSSLTDVRRRGLNRNFNRTDSPLPLGTTGLRGDAGTPGQGGVQIAELLPFLRRLA